VNSGFTFIEDIVWIKPEPSVKNRNAGFYRHRKPLAYKPNSVTEYIMIYRKTTDKLIDWNLSRYDDDTINHSLIRGNYERSNAWHINPESSDSHPAVYPEELSDKIIQYYSFKGDVVLDPFMGSGTTAVSCKKLGRKWIGFERSEEFCKIARKRIKDYKVFKKMDAFFSDA
jgi:DNA modification methylase